MFPSGAPINAAVVLDRQIQLGCAREPFSDENLQKKACGTYSHCELQVRIAILSDSIHMIIV